MCGCGVIPDGRRVTPAKPRFLFRLTLVHLEKICFAPTLCEPAACTQPVPRVPVAACDCARVCGSHGKRYELLRPPTLASAALLADDPAERASAAGWKGGCLAQRFAATTYESRTTPWVQRALALSAARSMVAARPPTAKLQRVAWLCLFFAPADVSSTPIPGILCGAARLALPRRQGR